MTTRERRAIDVSVRLAELALAQWRKANPNATWMQELAKVYEIGGVILGSRR